MKRLKKQAISNNDQILDGFTVGELITTVYANIGTNATEDDVRNTFEELMYIQREDAEYMLEEYMSSILYAIKN